MDIKEVIERKAKTMPTRFYPRDMQRIKELKEKFPDDYHSDAEVVRTAVNKLWEERLGGQQ